MDISLVIPAFVAGLLTFLAPCTFPLLPGYLGFISGTSLDDLKDPERAKTVRRKILLNGAVFMLGFAAVFIVLGTLVGFVGSIFLAPYRIWLMRIGGLFVILFGLFMLGAVKIPFLLTEKRIHVPPLFQRGRAVNSFILGGTFALGWTPCVGPILGSILFVASASQTALQGGLLLAVFCAGLTVPFIVIAACIGSVSMYMAKISLYLDAVSIVGGLLLIFIGILLLTGNFSFLISRGYFLFRFINYDALINYL